MTDDMIDRSKSSTLMPDSPDTVFDQLKDGSGGALTVEDCKEMSTLGASFSAVAERLIEFGRPLNRVEILTEGEKEVFLQIESNGRDQVSVAVGRGFKVLSAAERAPINMNRNLMEGTLSNGNSCSILREPEYIGRTLVFSTESGEPKLFLAHQVSHDRNVFGTSDLILNTGEVEYIYLAKGESEPTQTLRSATALDLDELRATHGDVMEWAQGVVAELAHKPG